MALQRGVERGQNQPCPLPKELETSSYLINPGFRSLGLCFFTGMENGYIGGSILPTPSETVKTAGYRRPDKCLI